MQRFENFMDGRRVPSVSEKWLSSLDPYRNETWREIPDSTAEDVDAAVKAAAQMDAEPDRQYLRLALTVRLR